MVMTSSALGYDTPPLPVQDEVVEAAQEAVESIEVGSVDNFAKFSIEEVEELEDGGLVLKMKIDYTVLVLLAKIGLSKCIENAVNETLDEHGPY